MARAATNIKLVLCLLLLLLLQLSFATEQPSSPHMNGWNKDNYRSANPRMSNQLIGYDQVASPESVLYTVFIAQLASDFNTYGNVLNTLKNSALQDFYSVQAAISLPALLLLPPLLPLLFPLKSKGSSHS